ncbi:hypothetical protein B484DRAFT_454628 [Ochromonadaceae sp. CCMP2298]|nr:hypothetical protein B484DRAFT_454628 [Ochromonadaceae sp. CCMP2298]
MQCTAILLALACIVHLQVADAFLPVSRPQILRTGASSVIASGTALQMSTAWDSGSYLLKLAQAFVESDFGVTQKSLLSSEFSCSGPTFKGISRESYLAGLAKETEAFQTAVPDFDIRGYDFQVDALDPSTVWFKIRPRGTITGPFVYQGQTYLPNNRAFELPVQQMSITLAKETVGKITRVTAGYVVDRLTGNTGGLPGPLGVLHILGDAPYLPPPVALPAPFQEPEMISLARATLLAGLGRSDPSLLAEDFQYSDPLLVLSKSEYLDHTLAVVEGVEGADKLTPASFQVDSLEPDRVWVIARSTGGAPEAISISLDSRGLCYRITSGYSLDIEQGDL